MPSMAGDDIDPIHNPAFTASDDDASTSDEDSEDGQLKEAFVKGQIDTSRLNRLVPFVRRDVVNNLDGLKKALKDLSNGLPWLERLDMNNDPAPVAPELAAHLDEQQPQQLGAGKSTDDDFRREVLFYRQAQTAVLQGLPILRNLGLPTRRPEDYFAQMLKSDDHMQKVREVLVNKQLAMERREKARKLRDLKKYGKQVQNEVLQRRAKEKRETLESVKKFRKGQKDKLDFLEGSGNSKKQPMASDSNRRDQQKNNQKSKKQQKLSLKRKAKDNKYGFGGKKKRSKYNDAESSADMSGYRSSRKRTSGQSKKSGGKYGNKGGSSKKQKKQGKARHKRK